MRFNTPDKEPGKRARLFLVEEALSPMLSWCIAVLQNPGMWNQSGEMTPDECSQAFWCEESIPIGTIIPGAGWEETLDCNGQQVLVTDFSELADALPDHVDAGMITLPDLSQWGVYSMVAK